MQLSIGKGIQIFKDLITNLTFFISFFRSHKKLGEIACPEFYAHMKDGQKP